MPDKIVDEKKLGAAIDKAEELQQQIQDTKKPIGKSKNETTRTKSISKKTKSGTIRQTTTKKTSFKKPSDFKDDIVANTINNLVNKILDEKNIAEKYEFGECVALCIDYYLPLVDLEHPLLQLGFASAGIGYVAISKKTDWLNFGKKKNKTEKDTPPLIFTDSGNKKVIQ